MLHFAFLFVILCWPLWGQQANSPPVRRGQLPFSQRAVAAALGDRLEVKGKERQVLTGKLESYAAGGVTVSDVRIVLEFPDKIRVDDTTRSETVIFGGTGLSKGGGPVRKGDEDLVQTLLDDTTDGLLASTVRGLPQRSIGRRVVRNAAGVFQYACDAIQVVADDRVKKTPQQFRDYCFDVLSFRLRSVTYRIGTATVDVSYPQWFTVSGQLFPAEVVRSENGQRVLRLTVSQATLEAKAADNLFAPK